MRAPAGLALLALLALPALERFPFSLNYLPVRLPKPCRKGAGVKGALLREPEGTRYPPLVFEEGVPSGCSSSLLTPGIRARPPK